MSPLTRRHFLLQAALAPLAVARSGEPDERPDIVFVLADDLRADALGFMGDPLARTPHIDRLAAEGAAFAEHFVVLSLCSPSRATILSGLYPHANGVTDNQGRGLAPEIPTFPALLRASGYTTAYIGKWHMDDTAAPRPGFDRWVSFRGQATYEDPTLNIDGVERIVRGYTTDLLTDEAVRWLSQPRDRPRLLYLAHKGTHAPFRPAARHAGLLADAPVPPLDEARWRGRPDWVEVRASRMAKTPEERQRFMRDYHETLMSVDDSVGRVLEALGDRLDRTVVVFSSDNGYQWGEHGLYEKTTIYEPSIRVPLLVRYPPLAQAGSRVDAMTLNVDFAATFLALGGVEAPPGHGRSLLPLLAGTDAGWRESFLFEFFASKEGKRPHLLGLRTKRYTLSTCPGSEERKELYDLVDDPEQLRNLAASPFQRSLVSRLEGELQALAEELDWKLPSTEPPDDRVPRTGAVVLDYAFDHDLGEAVLDSSGSGLDGLAIDAPPGEEEGRRVRRFEGGGALLVPRAKALDLSRGPWTVEVLVKAVAGTVLAHGGSGAGLALLVRDGKVAFVVNAAEKRTRVDGPEVAGRWTHLVGVLGTSDQAEPLARLYVDGALAGEAALPAFLGSEPEDPMHVGADRGIPVVPEPVGLTGLVSRVRVWAGERSAAQVAQDAAALLGGPVER